MPAGRRPSQRSSASERSREANPRSARPAGSASNGSGALTKAAPGKVSQNGAKPPPATLADAGAGAAQPPKRRRPRTTAGRCLAVGLVCFGIWLMLDANQLYLSAQAQPPGSRRTVAMTILRPLAAVSNALGLSSFVDGANDALGRANGPGGSSGIGPNYNPQLPPSGPASVFPAGTSGLPHEIWRPKLKTLLTTHPAGPPPLPPVRQPTAGHPLVMLDVGDSLGEDLGFGLADQFGGNQDVKLYLDAQESTGLADPAYYDWPAHLKKFISQYHPAVVVAMFGGNDNHNFMQFNQGVVFGTPLWRTDYGERVAEIMDDVTESGARLIWVGMPIMQDPTFSAQMAELDSVYAAEAATHPGVTYFSSWKLFSNSAGHYSTYLNNTQGQEIQARDLDGVHIAPGGYDMLAAAMVAPMERAWHIRF